MNYRWTMHLLEQEINLCRRYNSILSMVLLDIDFFKKINDTYGHLIGNDILKSFAECIKKNLRNADIIGRYGGEEFLIILPETTPDFAATILERIKERLQHIKIDSSSLEGATEVSIKFSAGIVSCPNNARELKGLIGMADYALLKAKNLGRNRWILE